jgi:trehalose monomycolate/heme transporter
MPIPTEHPAGQRQNDQDLEDPATTAIPTAPRDEKDPDVATQKLNARGKDAEGGDRTRQRRGGGLSAQDLLRREGRI